MLAAYTKAGVLSGEGAQPLDAYIQVLSDHDGRPNTASMRDYGVNASADNPWELRLKRLGGTPLVMMVTHMAKLVGEPGSKLWLLEGTFDEREVNLVWSTFSRQGTLRYGKYNEAA